jgi:AcrR family transcriptional regulator
MAPPTRTPASKWIEEGLRALATGGPDAVRIELLARALGVTKGGFYNHFDDRPALLDEMLDTWEQLGVDRVIERVEAEGGDARARLRRLFAVSSATRDLLKIELAIREWARRDRAVARRLKRIDNRRLEFLRSLFSEICSDEEEVELRCLVTLSMFVGVPSLAADYGARRRAELHRQAFERLIEVSEPFEVSVAVGGRSRRAAGRGR